MVDSFAHAAGLLLLAHTGRIRMFDASAARLMEAYIEERIEQLKEDGDDAIERAELGPASDRSPGASHAGHRRVRGRHRQCPAFADSGADAGRSPPADGAEPQGAGVHRARAHGSSRRGEDCPILAKQEFDACRAPGFFDRLPHRSALILAGCEAHVCVLQTALGLLAEGNHVYVVRDAVGSRRPESKATALDRLARHGVEIVTTEMVLFEWLETASHPRFREVVALIK